MKKNVLGMMLVLLLAGTTLVYAEGMKGDMMGKGMKGDMMGKGMMDGKMMGQMHEMMESMMKKSVTATSDGGVVVLWGNKLTKYDKDMNVIKEVELKMDMDGMQKMMENMKNMCPMMGKGMMKDVDNDNDDQVPGKDTDHLSHHK